MWRATPELFALKLSRGRWKTKPHLQLLSEWLVDAAARRRKRIIITMPPRHGKSEMTSVWFPSWYLELFHDHRIMLASYEADFAASWGRRVRNNLLEHEAELDVRIARDFAAADRWETTEGGGMMTAGVDGAFTGKGANILLIDDPVKNAEKANSPGEREKVWNFYRSTAFTRLEPDGVVIIIMTRWHEDDLAGRLINLDRQNDLLAGEDAPEPFEVLNLPAIAEDNDQLNRLPGTALWPERFDERALAKIRNTLGTYFWSALYKQDPIPAEGGGLMFREEWFPILDEEPTEGWRWLRWWDRAATDPDPIKKNDPDWTVGVKLGIGPQRQLCVAHAERMRGSPGAVQAKMREVAERDGPGVFVCGAQDPAAAGISEVMTLKKLLKGFRCDFFPETGDKVVRAGLISAECEPKVGEKYGNVSVVRGDWNAAFFETLRVFPTKGKHDDDVDALSGAYSVVLKKFPAPAFASGGGVGTRSSVR